MKTIVPSPGTRDTRSGVALVVVLAMLVLATGLVMAFFSIVSSETTSSAIQSHDAQVKQLADSVVDIITGQIVEATKGFETDNSGNPIFTRPLAWASQPGAIRTFKENGQPDRVFKLYSARRLVANAAEFLNELNPSHTNADVPTNWASRTALYTDLNAPVKDETGQDVYPILDPSAINQVEGFFFYGAAANGTTYAVPMPAQWLYILKDGTITSPTLSASTGNLASWGGGSGAFVPSANNPIVARIAFWTDDETAKVNINTASEGSFWDTPRANTQQERGFAKFQPAQREFQRYPGHPATTSLSAVFPNRTPNEIYQIVPRVVGGGSNNGTAVASNALMPDSDRLYASLDELLFRDKDRNTGPISKSDLERTKFFLTTSSRAPETNLFNQPRVAIWPLDSNTNIRTSFDRLIARCSTIVNRPFYFQRSNPRSATADFPGPPAASTGLTGVNRNRNIYYYLQQLTSRPFPGFGPNTFSSKYGADRDQILTEIFDYIRCTNLDDSTIPEANRFGDRAEETPASGIQRGFGQIVPIEIGNTRGFGRFPVITEAGIQFICTATPDNPATPSTDESLGSNVPTNKTLGANGTLTHPQRRIEALFFLETFIPGQGWPPVQPALTFRVRGLDSFSITTNATTSLGFPADEYDLSDTTPGGIYHGREWGGSNSHRVLLAYSKLRQRGVMKEDANPNNLQRYQFVSVPITVDASGGTMSFSGGTIIVDVYHGRNGNNWPGPAFPSANSGNLVQSYTFNFPGGTFPIPRLVATGTPVGTGTSNVAPATDKEHWWTFSKDGAMPGKTGRADFWHHDPGFPTAPRAGAPFRAEDVVRTLVPSQDWADVRLLAATKNVPGSAFTRHPDYDNSNKNLAHSITEGGGSGYFADFSSSSQNLVPGISWNSARTPDIPIANSNSETNGDWDTGVSITTDGAYINKPDEGNIQNIANSTPYFESSHVYTATGVTFFSPNRQMPSPGMFGSLPTGINAGKAFQTLLFRPQPGHPGANSPKDHLLMDLFWMPVVEPYAISEPFSTAGKINMNYQIVPFTYIERATGLHALLKSERVAAIPASAASTSDSSDYKRGLVNSEFRLPINIQETLSQFAQKFAAGEIFKSATEICDLHIVPEGQTVSSMNGTFWNTHRLTGENLRERIYTTLYPRLTTKSNTFTVHFRVQALRKNPSTPANQWLEGRDQVLAEYRGSTTIERYIDPDDPRLPDFATETDQAKLNLDQYYRFRTISTRRFAP